MEKRILEHLYIAEIKAKECIGRGVEYDDLYQIACLAIIKADQMFDESQDVSFATYATRFVSGYIKNYFRDKGSFIKIPRALYNLMCNDPEGEAAQRAKRMLSVISTDSPEFIENEVGEPDDSLIMIENRDYFKSLISSLNDEEKEFVQLRYFEEKTQAEIAEIKGYSQMTASRIEKRIIQKLKTKA